MPRDDRSLSSRFLPTRAAIRIIGLLVNASVLITGCASPSFVPGAFRTLPGELSEHSTVRSQDSALTIAWGSPVSSGSSAADDGQRQSRFGTSTTDAEERHRSLPIVPGHSFLQPRARLGRPILLPDDGVMPGTIPAEPDNSQPSQADASRNTGRFVAPVPGDSQETSGRTSWTSGNGFAWQPIAAGVPSWTQLDKSFSGGGNDNVTPQSNSLPPSISATDSSTSNRESSLDVGATVPLSEAPATTGNDSGAEISETPSESKAASAPEQEPTMLDRFRGLYAPRLEDNTDKLRKQIRRWPDPFRLLKDRDDAAESIPATSPSQPAGNETQSDEAVSTADLSPSIPENTMAPLDSLIADLEQVLAEWPGTSSGKPERPEEWRQRQTDLRLLYMMAGRSAESIRVIESLPEEEQEFWQSLMLSMNRYREVRSDTTSAARMSETLDHLRAASRKLQLLSTLQIRHMMFCDRIDGFGNVSAFPTADFNPGQRILVYMDVQNFRSELTPDGKYRSEFAAVIEFMRQGDDEIVETIRLPQILDHCTVERTDYFQSFELTLPALAGQYVVHIRLRDQLSLQTAESQLEFSVRSQNSGL